MTTTHYIHWYKLLVLSSITLSEANVHPSFLFYFLFLLIHEQYYIRMHQQRYKKGTLYFVLCTWDEYAERKLKLFPLKTAIFSLENL